MKTTPLPLLTLALAAWAALPAQAQSLSAQAQDHAAHHHGSDDNAAPPQAPATAPPAATTPLHTGHDESLPSSSHSHNHTPTQPDTTQSPPDGMAPMAQGDADGQGGAAPLDARDPNAYSDGLVRGAGVHAIPGVSPLRLADEHRFGALVLDRLERAHTRGGDNATAYDLQAWYGRDFDKAVLKAEGEVAGGTLHDARTELLWGHAITPYWDTQLGVRYDAGTGPDRGWLAFGVQGLAPYWFEVEATAYLGDGGRSALRLAASYDLLLTQKLILQPRGEAQFYGKNDPARTIGSGLSHATLGLRLRYEFSRQLAPYLGLERAGSFGRTADYLRTEGARAQQTRWLAGVRFWF